MFNRFMLLSMLVSSVLVSESSHVEETVEPTSYWSHQETASEDTSSFSAPFIRVSQKAIPACIFITAEGKKAQSSEPFDLFNDDFFHRFFGGPSKRRSNKPSLSQGSGFIVSKDGYAMTNAHVVAGADRIVVHLQDESKRQYEASLIGMDLNTDIAVIKIESKTAETFPYLEMGNSDKLKVGQWVVAVGNPFGLQSTVTTGIISAKGRQNLNITDHEDFIQTEAAINPGNSGGPLIDLKGLVIGMNTAIYSQSGGHMGLGFAIPQKVLSNVKDQLIEKGSVTRGFLGVTLQSITPELAQAFDLKTTHGALVAGVVKGSPADKAGIKQGDIILKMDGKTIKDPSMLKNAIVLMAPDTSVTLTVNRNGSEKKVRVKLATHGHNTLVSSMFESKALGLRVDNLTPENLEHYRIAQEQEGVLIADVIPDSPAAYEGLRPGSVIVMVNRQKVKNVRDFEELMQHVTKGDRVLLLIKQGNVFRFCTLQAD